MKGTDTVGELGDSQGSKAGFASLGMREVMQPVNNTVEIHGCGGCQVLQVGFHEAKVTSLAQPKRPHPLGNCTLNACPALIELSSRLTGQVLLGALPRLELCLAWQTQTTNLALGLRA